MVDIDAMHLRLLKLERHVFPLEREEEPPSPSLPPPDPAITLTAEEVAALRELLQKQASKPSSEDTSE